MNKNKTGILVHIIFVLIGIICIVPFMMIVSASFSSESDLARYGFSVLPKKVDLTAYAYLFANPAQIINAYKMTIFVTVVGTFFSIIVIAMAAYALARPNFKLRNIMTAYFFLPTLFSGGTVSSYIINSKYLHAVDTTWILIVPSLFSVFYCIMMRTFFKQLPEGLFDAAKIDGAGEWRICFTIAMRLSKPVLATVAFMEVKTKWNMWTGNMYYTRSPEKYTLQYLLQRMMMNIDELINSMEKVPGMFEIQELPGENLRMAMLVVCIGPMMLVFPFFQKYFTKGMTVGAVKG